MRKSMIPTIVLSLMLVFPAYSLTETKDTNKLRISFYQAATNKEKMSELNKAIEISDENKSLRMAYDGMYNMLQARYGWNPFERFFAFLKGRDKLEKSISSLPKSLELRFLRFSIQTNAPWFLNYHYNIDNDKKLLLSGIEKLDDQDLQERIIEFFMQSSFISKEEKEYISKLQTK